MSDDPIIERLEALGRTHQSSPTPERVGSIESTVLTAISTAEPLPARSSRRRPAVPVLLAVVVLLVVAVLLVVFVVAPAWFAGGSDLTVQEYDGAVTIELPDGRTLDAEVGLDVPDGSFVEVDPDGSLLLGDDELGPGHYEIRDGQAVPSSAAVGTTTTTTTTTSDVAPTPVSIRPLVPTSTEVPGADLDLDGPPAAATTSVAPVRPTTTVSGDRPPPRTTLVDRPSTTSPVRRTTTTTTVVVDITRPSITLATDRPPRTTTTEPARTTTTTSSSLPAD